jgi:hypothetical protein
MYRVHADMKTRCTNPKFNGTEHYMAKGITYDRKWESFAGFSEDMLDTYIDGYSLDRKDNSKGYSKENCQWVPRTLQTRNKTKAKTNSSGVTGVRWDTKYKMFLYAVCHWYELDGKKIQKSFSVDKLGLLPAFATACEYRGNMIAKLNSQGAGYGELHGK